MNSRHAITTLTILLLLVLCSARAAFTQQLPPPQSVVTAQQAPTTSAATAIPTYPDSPKGLEKLIKDVLKLEKRGDEQVLASYYQSFVLPEPNVWLKNKFGDKVGSQLAASYASRAQSLPQEVALTIKKLIQEDLTGHFAVVDYNKLCDTPSFLLLDSQSEHLTLGTTEIRGKGNAMYRLLFRKGSTVSEMAFFVYDNGAFRYLGQPAITTLPSGAPEASIQTDDSIQMAKLVYSVRPEYPTIAKSAKVQGTVLLHAIIGKNGSLEDLSYISGPDMLKSSAINSVKQWKYRPTLLNGKPVAVDTCITVVYSLAGD